MLTFLAIAVSLLTLFAGVGAGCQEELTRRERWVAVPMLLGGVFCTAILIGMINAGAA